MDRLGVVNIVLDYVCMVHMRYMYFQVIIAAELLKNADELVKCKIHPTSIISGYRMACK